jgi:type IV pilus assembly protein PilB
LNLGVKPYQLIDALLGATALVLVRRICLECGGEGCPKCDSTGFYGRIPLQEVMIFSENMKDALLSTTNIYMLRKIAQQEGLISMLEDGFEKAAQGMTTRDEIHRVARRNNIEAGTRK